jgi:hypothetical protein
VFCLFYGKNTYLSPAAHRLIETAGAKSDVDLPALRRRNLRRPA